MAHYRRDTLQNDKIWFQYRGKKQFEPFFEAKFDPNNNYFNFFYMYNFFYQYYSTKKIHKTYYFCDNCKSGEKMKKKENFFLAVNIKKNLVVGFYPTLDAWYSKSKTY